MLGLVLVALGSLWLLGQLLSGLVALPLADWLAREADPQRYWQFVYLVPSLLLALGFFLLRYRVRSIAGLRREKVNCAAFVLVSAGIALVLGKLSCLLLPHL
ncbi:hypothetical protein [Pseudomonas citronellolis]|uniref:hypothetical protein n=1 Tax=Pseudomonas citronellolis TaxID=53408 RepID=UPI0023E38C40|nr:hypothetical protein [Pseudomonas citronellolis]MDF3934248.1 hypothetical protein [Pseudomonas citronellolis]